MTILARRTMAMAAAAVVGLSSGGCASRDDAAVRPDNPAGVVISNVDRDSRFSGSEPATPYDMPDVTLTATNNRPFNLVSDTAYPLTLVFFGYTNCSDVCPLVMSDLTSAYRHLPTGVRDQTQVLFVTTDPARDDPAALRGYLSRYDDDFVGLTGSLRDIVTAAEAMGVAIEGRHKLPHGAQVIGFKDDVAPVVWTVGTSVDAMVTDITGLAAS